MSRFRGPALVLLAALAGIAVAAAVTWGTSQLVRQHIGLASEPLTAGSSLLPPLIRSSPPAERLQGHAHTSASAPHAPAAGSAAATPVAPTKQAQVPPAAAAPVAPPSSNGAAPAPSAPAAAPSSSGAPPAAAGHEGGDTSAHRDD
jgi:hypothetical protein